MGPELPDTVRLWVPVFVGEWTPPDVERFLLPGVGARLGFDSGGADVMLATDLVRELLRDIDTPSEGRGR